MNAKSNNPRLSKNTQMILGMTGPLTRVKTIFVPTDRDGNALRTVMTGRRALSFSPQGVYMAP